MITYNTETSSQRCDVLFRCYWNPKTFEFIAQIFFTSKAELPLKCSFERRGNNIVAEHPQGIKAAWYLLIEELKDTKNKIGFCNENYNGHPTCTYANDWFDRMFLDSQ